MCGFLYPKYHSISAYIRQRGACRFCGVQVALSGGRYYDTIPRADPHWRAVYGTEARASAAFRLLRGSMARMACPACAPPEAARRSARLRPPAALEGPAEVVAFVRRHYAALNRGVASEAEQQRWAAAFAAETGHANLTAPDFIGTVWGPMRSSCRATSTSRSRP
jgi:hypothetical protein